jgi:hypothetical protein
LKQNRFACKAFAHASVISHASRTISVGLKYPASAFSVSESCFFRRLYVGLFASCVINCHALTANSKSAGTSARHFSSVFNCGG